MLIVCPSCATSYDVGLASLGPRGRPVRCARCREVWHAAPSRADKLFAAAEALAPERAVAEDAAQAAAGELAAEPAAAASSQTTWSESAAYEPQNAEQWGVELNPGSAAAEGRTFAAARNGSAEVEAPPIVPVDLDEGQPIDIGADDFAGHHAEPRADIETIAARRQRRGGAKRRPAHWPLSRLQSGILALVLVDSILVGWRGDFVRALPQTASFYAMIGLPVNLRGVVFDGIATSTEQHEGVPILVVQGNIVNDTGKVVDVPRLKFVVRNAARQEIYSWTAVPSRPMLPPGEAVVFRSRLASPPPDGRDVVVRFVTRHDVVAATR